MMGWMGFVTRAVVTRAVATAALFLALGASPASAAPFTVDSTVDAVDVNPGDGTCATAADACTLRAAIQEANALAGADQISLPAGTYYLTIDGRNEDAAATGDLDITSEVTITGASARTVRVSGDGDATEDLHKSGVDRVFDVLAGAAVAMSHLTVQDGTGQGGGNVRAVAPLSLSDVTVKDSWGTGDGGGVWASGVLNLNRVTINRNHATNGGGIATSGPLTAVNSTIFGNDASTDGGGVDVLAGGDVDLTNVTLAFNRAAGGTGGQLFNAGAVEIRNGLLERTSPSGPNCGGAPPVSGGYNVNDDASCALTGPGDRGTDYYAWTYYQLLNVGGETDVLKTYDFPGVYGGASPAVDTGAQTCPAEDQRGLARPQGQSCDAGAYEATFADLTITAVNVPTEVVGAVFRYSLTIRNDGPATAHAPQVSSTGPYGTGLPFPDPSIGGQKCPIWCGAGLAPLAPGESVTIDMDHSADPPSESKDYIVDYEVYDLPFDPAVTNIDPNPANSKVRVVVPLKPLPVVSPPAQQAKPEVVPLKPCSLKKSVTRRNNVLTGTAGSDLLRGLGGNDRIRGLAGDDCLDGGSGNDTLIGGAGRDKLVGGLGADVISAADHEKDTIDCGRGRDRAVVDRIDRVKHCEKVNRKR